MCRLKDLVEKIPPPQYLGFFCCHNFFPHNMGLISTTQNLVDNNTVPIQWITSRNSIQCRFFPTLFISGLCWRFCIGPSTTSPPLAQVDPAHPGPDRAQAQRMRLILYQFIGKQIKELVSSRVTCWRLDSLNATEYHGEKWLIPQAQITFTFSRQHQQKVPTLPREEVLDWL